MKRPILIVPLSAILLVGCSMPGEEERLAKQGLPPADYVPSAERGRELFAANCAGCHGKLMNGTNRGPALMHKYYKPKHHSDLAFYRAIKNGVRAHHWNFGDMPPRPEVSPKDAADIIAYVRERQQKMGLY